MKERMLICLTNTITKCANGQCAFGPRYIPCIKITQWLQTKQCTPGVGGLVG